MQWWHQSLKSKPTARNVVCLFCFLVFFTIFAQWFMLEGWQQQLDDEIPVDFKDEKEISSNYSEALNQLQDLCLANKNSIIAIGQHKEKQEEENHPIVIHENDPYLLEKLKACPIAEVFVPLGIRTHGYCQDAIAYVKFLQGRLLPAWVFEKEFIIDGKKNQTYYDICPTTPLIFLNHYFDGINTNSKWPKKKPIYLMPNIEMYELRASHFWNVDVVLCKTHECYRRVRDWYKQRGNPRHTKVFYTRHTSPDPTSHAFLNLPPNSIRPKDFNDLTFTHTAGTSPSKGTNQIIDCWKKRPDFPHLNVYMSKNTYTNQYQQLEKDFIHGNIHLKPGLLDNIQFGKILAESSVILCPSYNEGYGHYINQAKAAGAVVVTTNGPPMNELITSKRGILIPVQPRKDKYQLLSGAFDGSNGLEGDYVGLQSWFDPKELCHAVEKILDLTPKQREQLAIAARRSYLQDMLFFQKSMNTLKAFIRFNASLA